MSSSTAFDYYYGDESSQFSFYRIPRQLVTGQQFKKISTDAKLLYGLLLDRMGLSARNSWYDDAGRVYIFYTLDEIQEDLNCGHEKAVKLLSELDTDKGCGLIERMKQGQARFYRLDYSMMVYVFESLHRNTTKVRNIRAYLLTTLFNAPLTMNNYYQAEVQHDFGL